tara:strand:- start:187 stop:465 length:279 start_codon:yes stop_codon:yes gene_type:complete
MVNILDIIDAQPLKYEEIIQLDDAEYLVVPNPAVGEWGQTEFFKRMLNTYSPILLEQRSDGLGSSTPEIWGMNEDPNNYLYFKIHGKGLNEG